MAWLLAACAVAVSLLLLDASFRPRASIRAARELVASHGLQRLVTAPSGHRDRHPEMTHPAVPWDYAPGEVPR